MANSEKEDRSLEIKTVVEEMKLYNNPEELEELKKQLKKNVPLSMRGYLMAYLYLNFKGRTARPQHHRQTVENGVVFYINIGKTSRRPARELGAFICETANLEESDILSISYKQNYSFVTIKKEKSEGIIDSINGKVYRERKVKINYSKENNEN